MTLNMRKAAILVFASAMLAGRSGEAWTMEPCVAIEDLEWPTDPAGARGPSCVDVGGIHFEHSLWMPCDQAVCVLALFQPEASPDGDSYAAWARFEEHLSERWGIPTSEVRIHPNSDPPASTTIYRWDSGSEYVLVRRRDRDAVPVSVFVNVRARGEPGWTSPPPPSP